MKLWPLLVMLTLDVASILLAYSMIPVRLPRARMRVGVKQLVLSVCQSVCQSGETFLNLNIDRVKRFPKLTVALTL